MTAELPPPCPPLPPAGPTIIVPPPYQLPPPRRSAFETFMLTITGMSALGILALLLLPLLICVGLTMVCVIGGIGVAHMPTPTPFRP